MAAPPPPPAELLTQLQDQLHTVSKMFFDFVGILQRDAPPLSVSGEPVVAAPAAAAPHPPQQPPLDVEQTTQLMATQLIDQFKITETLIRALPQDRATAAEQTGRIRDLQRQHEEVSAQLDAAAREAEAQLGELQRMFAVLAQQRLREAQGGVALPPLAPLSHESGR